MTRRLAVRRETLTELAAGDLRAVAGGASVSKCLLDDTYVCLTDWTGYYPSINAPCTTD